MKNNSPLRSFLAPLLFLAPALLLASSSVAAADSLVNFNIENSPLVDNPWAGVDGSGNLKVPAGQQLEVDDSGKIITGDFSPSIAVGDLNGDGLPDLVLADGRGFLWFFPNVGTKTQPLFSHGEIIPVWFGSDTMLTTNVSKRDVVPRIQLVDFNGDGRPDLVVGNFEGRLFLLPNSGTPTQPAFRQPNSLDDLEVPTRSQGVLWCNYLAPTLYPWSGPNGLDLIMGEGSYSANSIYLLRNQGGSGRPSFSELQTLRIIRGNGREQLTPRVVDWNGDGKPDIITGERTGEIEVFLNTTTDPQHPTFDNGTQVRLGSQQEFGKLTTVEVADLTGNHLPNLVFSNATGALFYAVNTGTPGHPQFASDPVPLKGTNPYPKIYQPEDWTLSAPYGNAYGLLVATCADVEKGFEPPPDHPGKFALRAYVFTPQTTWFTDRYICDAKKNSFSNEPSINYTPNVPIQAGVRYQITFNAKLDGDVDNPRFVLEGSQRLGNGTNAEIRVDHPVSVSNSWTKVSETFSITSHTSKDAVVPLKLSIRWRGEGAFYLDDVTLGKAQ